MIVGVADQRLGREVEDDFGAGLGNQGGGARLIANVDDLVADEFTQPRLLEEAGIGRRIERQTRDLGSHVMQPEA